MSYWRFEGTIAPGGKLADEKGDANPGTYPEDGGVSAGKGVIGQGGEFSGEPFQVVEIANEENFDFDEFMTVEAWFKTEGWDKSWQAIVNKGDDQWRLHRRSAECGLAFGRDEDGTTNRDTNSSGICVDDGEWHQGVAVFDIDKPAALYVDGELAMTGSQLGDDAEPLGPLNTEVGANIDLPVMIGGNAQDGAHWRSFTGSIDEVSIYNRALTAEQVKSHYMLALNDPGGGGVAGDFDADGALDVDDINALLREVKAGTNRAAFDLNKSGGVDASDIKVWVNDLKRTYIGDANLDGEFSSSDFVATFTAGKYETGLEANWGQGDWNGDGVFTSSDFVDAFTGGGYEKGPRAAISSVPEPTGLVLMLLGLLGWAGLRR